MARDAFRATVAGSPTSPARQSAFSGGFVIASLSTRMTFAPRAANRLAAAVPIPDAAPVTTATRPVRLKLAIADGSVSILAKTK